MANTGAFLAVQYDRITGKNQSLPSALVKTKGKAVFLCSRIANSFHRSASWMPVPMRSKETPARGSDKVPTMH